MSEHQTKLTPEEQRRWVKLKWDLLANASTDEAVTAGNFRFMFRVLQQLDLQTWTCTIADDRVCAELPGCRNRKTAEDHRAAIIKAGYWTTDSGSGRHATRYFVAEEIPERAIAGIASKRQAFQEERANRPKPNRAGVISPRKVNLSRGQTAPDIGVILPPVQVSSSSMALRQQDETQDARALMPASARTQVRAHISPPPLENNFDDTILRCNCGKPAAFEIRISFGAGPEAILQCRECREEDDSIIDEVRLIAASDSAVDYRRVRDGS